MIHNEKRESIGRIREKVRDQKYDESSSSLAYTLPEWNGKSEFSFWLNYTIALGQ